MDAFERRTPHYLRIYRDLKHQIADGAFAPGERLATQRELAARHGVTVMTVRQALQLLEQEELVVSRHGLGTFVAPQRIDYEIGNLRSLAQEAAAQGLDLRTFVLRRGLVAPHPRVAEVLRVEASGPVLSIERLRSVGQQAVVYQQSYLPAWLEDALEGVDLGSTSLYDHIQGTHKIALVRAHERIHAIGLAAPEALLLDEPDGAPALLSERITYSATGDPILFDRAFMPGDRVSVTSERVVSDISVGYELRLAEERS
jgi:GntR family transcriptional regulator